MTTTEGPSWAQNRSQLRLNAETLIDDGKATVTNIGGGALGVEALSLLYRRASDPDFAADALKLLHELQTHQVELDLLLEQLQTSETDLTEELAHYHMLYQFAPAAYLVVSRDGRLIESNAAADALLGCSPEPSEPQPLAQYLAPQSRAGLASLLETLGASGSVATCTVGLAGRPDFPLSIRACVSPAGDKVMMVISDDTAPDTAPAQS
ncbi:MAG: PAS domain-containing protein [Pseudomonadota bacterium]